MGELPVHDHERALAPRRRGVEAPRVHPRVPHGAEPDAGARVAPDGLDAGVARGHGVEARARREGHPRRDQGVHHRGPNAEGPRGQRAHVARDARDVARARRLQRRQVPGHRRPEHHLDAQRAHVAARGLVHGRAQAEPPEPRQHVAVAPERAAHGAAVEREEAREERRGPHHLPGRVVDRDPGDGLAVRVVVVEPTEPPLQGGAVAAGGLAVEELCLEREQRTAVIWPREPDVEAHARLTAARARSAQPDRGRDPRGAGRASGTAPPRVPLQDVERVGAVHVGAAGHRLAQLVVVAGEIVDVLPEALLRGGREDGGQVDLASRAVLAAALDGAGGAREAGGDRRRDRWPCPRCASACTASRRSRARACGARSPRRSPARR